MPSETIMPRYAIGRMNRHHGRIGVSKTSEIEYVLRFMTAWSLVSTSLSLMEERPAEEVLGLRPCGTERPHQRWGRSSLLYFSAAIFSSNLFSPSFQNYQRQVSWPKIVLSYDDISLTLRPGYLSVRDSVNARILKMTPGAPQRCCKPRPGPGSEYFVARLSLLWRDMGK
jgi:hypothetical protein